MGFRGGVKLTPPPSISWFSSTPAGIGLKWGQRAETNILVFQLFFEKNQIIFLQK